MCCCQHQHVYLNYSLSLTVGNTKIPTDFITIVQAKYLHAGWHKETKGGPAPLQTARVGASLGMSKGTWISAPLSSFGGTLQGASTFLWQNSAQYTVSWVSVEHVPGKTGPAFLPSLLCVTGYTEKKKQTLAKIKTFSKTVNFN